MPLNIKDQLIDTINIRNVKILGNPLTLAILIILIIILTMIFTALICELDMNKWKMICGLVVVLVILVPVLTFGYEWCRKKSLDEIYSKKTHHFVAPNKEYYERDEMVGAAPRESLSDYGDLAVFFEE